MKHECVVNMEWAAYMARINAKEALIQFKKGDYDFGQEHLSVTDEESAMEYSKARDETEKRLMGELFRARAFEKMIEEMPINSSGVYQEKDFKELLNSHGDDEILLSDISGFVLGMCETVIPEIVEYGMVQYAEACLKWLDGSDTYNKSAFVDMSLLAKLESMAEAHRLKLVFGHNEKTQFKKKVAL